MAVEKLPEYAPGQRAHARTHALCMRPGRVSSQRQAATRIAFLIVLGALLAAPAWAAGGAVHLGWGDCAGAGSSTAALSNACATNIGAIPLVCSFSPPTSISKFVSIEAQIDIYTSGTMLTPWWHLETQPSNGCRAGMISASFDFVSGPYTCMDPWAGQAVGAMEYLVNGMGLGTNTANIVLTAAVADIYPIQLNSGTEYYAFTIRMGRGQSNGPGSCEGCADRACFVLNYLTLGQPAEANNPQSLQGWTLTQGDQSAVTYNGGTGSSQCAAARTQKSSWGAIKAIYH
jgi:hypothetical protein